MIIEQPPALFRALYPEAIFRMNPKEKSVYLTFDDGPIPVVTPWVIDLLNHYKIKATFFMVGDNVRKHPEEYKMVIDNGHRIGNHTYNHLKGFNTSCKDYMENIMKMNEVVPTDLFRPPHGHLWRRQYKEVKKHFKVIMWDLVSRDYSKRMTPEEVLKGIKKYVRNGSIITFHDSLKSWNNGNLRYALPLSIEHILSEGYEFRLL